MVTTIPVATTTLPAGTDRPSAAENIVRAPGVNECGAYLVPAIPTMLVIDMEPGIENSVALVRAALDGAGITGAEVEEFTVN